VALIHCKECTKEISSLAEYCNGCGAPVNEELSNLKDSFKATNHILHLLLSLFSCGMWVPFWLLVILNNSNENSKTKAKIRKIKR
jgi:hypothetical protein